MKIKRIKIDRNTRVTIEDMNYILEYRVSKGDFRGEKRVGFKWELGGYFPTIDLLLKDYIENAPAHEKASKIKSLEDIIACIKRAEKRITRLIKNYGKK